MAEDETPHLQDPPPAPAPGSRGPGAHPGVMFRWGLYASLGVLAVAAATVAVYTTRALLVRVLIALFIAVSPGSGGAHADPPGHAPRRWPCW